MRSGIEIEPDRVRRNTADSVNARIDAATASNIRRYGPAPRSKIDARIRQLDAEWDIERVLEVNASALALSGLVLGLTVNRRWYLLSGTVLGFLLLHGLQGWCPPVPALRRMGVRTCGEIDRERLALKYLRGDFEDRLPPPHARRRLGALVSNV